MNYGNCTKPPHNRRSKVQILPATSIFVSPGSRNRFRGLAECRPVEPTILHSEHCIEVAAAEVLDIAYASVQDRATPLSDEGMRRAFIDNLPEDREIVAAWQVRQSRRNEH
jgi:hypothetical protein